MNYESGLNLDDNVFIPKEHKLFSAYPNPFNPSVNIPFELATQAHVVLNIYDLKGQKVETLMDKFLSEGVMKSIGMRVPILLGFMYVL